MQYLQLLDQILRHASETLWNPSILLAKFGTDLLFSQGIIFQPLSSLPAVNSRGEDIMQPELSRKHVHHYSAGIDQIFGCRLIVVRSNLGGRLRIRRPIQDICAGNFSVLGTYRIWDCFRVLTDVPQPKVYQTMGVQGSSGIHHAIADEGDFRWRLTNVIWRLVLRTYGQHFGFR